MDTNLFADTLQPVKSSSAWVDADDPVKAIRLWEFVTIVAHGTVSRHGGVDRKSRSAAINARKRAVEALPWTDADGKAIRVRLELVGKSYSETSGFMHASYFSYRIHREQVNAAREENR